MAFWKMKRVRKKKPEGEVKEEAILSLQSEDIKMLEELRQSL